MITVNSPFFKSATYLIFLKHRLDIANGVIEYYDRPQKYTQFYGSYSSFMDELYTHFDLNLSNNNPFEFFENSIQPFFEIESIEKDSMILKVDMSVAIQIILSELRVLHGKVEHLKIEDVEEYVVGKTKELNEHIIDDRRLIELL